MLKKKDQPYAQKLRIIQLFEADMNGALKYFMGRMLMRYATMKGILDSEAYGSRLGKSSIEAIINLQLIFDNHRIWKKIWRWFVGFFQFGHCIPLVLLAACIPFHALLVM